MIVLTEFYGTFGNYLGTLAVIINPSSYEFAIQECPFIVLSDLRLISVKYFVVDPPKDRGYLHTDITKGYTALQKQPHLVMLPRPS